jgi:hypothetical protein
MLSLSEEFPAQGTEPRIEPGTYRAIERSANTLATPHPLIEVALVLRLVDLLMNLWVQMKEMFVEDSPMGFTLLKVDWRETPAKLSWV